MEKFLVTAFSSAIVNASRLDPARVNDRSSGENGARKESLMPEFELLRSSLRLAEELFTLFPQQLIKKDIHGLLAILEKARS